MSPIMLSIAAHSFECLDLLLKAGADLNLVSCGVTPLAFAASQPDIEFMKILLTAGANPNVVGTPFDFILMHFKRELKRKENFLLAKQRGEEAGKKKDYLSAMVCYTEAIFFDPDDATVLSNRSLCWVHLNEGRRAVSDAQACVCLRPTWPKAHYREGVAWRLLGKYSMASEAFARPENKEICKALKESVKAESSMPVSSNNVEAFRL
ncbi:UNVERIFIED_CONTAM: E3 ubiquitin-protein ligase TTC3 [Sesamum radiatum]|uniref:E3 ubiquitin-protein ligase TTC3 n=1 Tax=Sesamum radiatum TaxID=300843 RepID=A0AAW2W0Z5_SESRA